METKLKLTKEQHSAIKSLERAFNKCSKANVKFHNCYGNLFAYDSNIVNEIDDNPSQIHCYAGHGVNIKYDLDSWADDDHYVHLKTD